MVRDFLALARPREWPKSLFCFAGVLFSVRVYEVRAWLLAAGAAVVFVLAAAAVYVLNDLFDRERDRLHPHKRTRPLARGALSPRAAGLFAVVAWLAALGAGMALGVGVAGCLALYAALQVLYSAGLKDTPVLDLVLLAAGLVLRALGGALAAGAAVDPAALVFVFFLGALLGLCKRRIEAPGWPREARQGIDRYSTAALDGLLSSTGALAVGAYVLLVLRSARPAALALTIPIVFYGVMDCKCAALQPDERGPTAQGLLTRRSSLECAALWLAVYLAVLYWQPALVS